MLVNCAVYQQRRKVKDISVEEISDYVVQPDAFVWVALLVYLWSIWRRLGKVEADLQTLERRSTPRSPAR